MLTTWKTSLSSASNGVATVLVFAAITTTALILIRPPPVPTHTSNGPPRLNTPETPLGSYDCARADDRSSVSV